MTNITAIQPREINFRTQTNADWLDTLIVWQAGSSGVVAGAENAGNGEVSVSGVAALATIGHHVVTVTSTDGLARYTIEHPDGNVTSGAVGIPLTAAGLTLTLVAGGTPFEVGDTFAIAVLPMPVDITGITFSLQVRAAVGSPTIWFSASSEPVGDNPPTISTGTTGGEVGMVVPKAFLSRATYPPGDYVYDILAQAEGRTVVAFFGTINHVDGVAYLP